MHNADKIKPMQHNSSPLNAAGNLVAFDTFLESLDKTRTTGWRWRKKGVIETQNVFGKIYVTRDEIARFEERVASGEFAKDSNAEAATLARLAKRSAEGLEVQ